MLVRPLLPTEFHRRAVSTIFDGATVGAERLPNSFPLPRLRPCRRMPTRCGSRQPFFGCSYNGEPISLAQCETADAAVLRGFQRARNLRASGMNSDNEDESGINGVIRERDHCTIRFSGAARTS